MGWGRAGWYSIDRIDNGGAPSARTLLPGIPPPTPGDVIPADGRGGVFEVLVADPPRALVLGVLIRGGGRRLLPFRAARDGGSWRMTWAFALRPLPGGGTRLVVRMRVAGPRSLRLLGPGIRAGHGVMQRAQLRNLARRVERP